MRFPIAVVFMGLLFVSGCKASGPPDRHTSQMGTPSMSAAQTLPVSKLTRTDINPAMSDKQKDAILKRKNDE